MDSHHTEHTAMESEQETQTSTGTRCHRHCVAVGYWLNRKTRSQKWITTAVIGDKAKQIAQNSYCYSVHTNKLLHSAVHVCNKPDDDSGIW